MATTILEKVEYPTLYKKTSTGAIQFWSIHVVEGTEEELFRDDLVPRIVTTYGQVGTDSPQVTYDPIFKGKNVGKKNETTPYQQAQSEAESKWEKQKKKGYVESKEAAEADEVDEIIEGGIVPMLAHKFTDHGHKIKYPAYVQPKLDGIRCIAIPTGCMTTLWSRTRKAITSMPHIQEELTKVFGDSGKFPDGELYNHEFKKDFEKIVSAVRKDNPEDGYLNVQYHVYDLANEGTFAERIEYLVNKIHTYEMVHGMLKYIRPVTAILVKNEEELMEAFNKCIELGYEGAMVRNAAGKYVNKRSYDLQKVKEFDDAEFEIIGAEEGRGKLQGHVGAFVCKMSNGKQFLAKMSGDTEKLAEYFRNPSSYLGKKLTVKYQGLTGAEGVPRFPVGVVIRDYE